MTHSPPTGGSKSHKDTKAMRREKITFLKIVLTVGILASLPITIILTNSARNNQDVRSKATQATLTPGRIIYIPFSFSKDRDDDALFEFPEGVQIRNGFAPQNVSLSGPQYTAKLFRNDGSFIKTENFSLPQFVAIDSYDRSAYKGKAEFRKVAANNFGITLPYFNDVGFVRIINPKGDIVGNLSLENTTPINNILDIKEIRGEEIDKKNGLIQKAKAANGTFNIAVIGDNYNGDFSHFQSDVIDIASGLLSIEPFKSYKNNIVFYTQLSAVPICSFSTSLSCSDTLALQQASGLPYDKVYILYNGPFGGYAYVGATLSYGTNATGMPLAVKQSLFIHEMAGHVLGELMDEYSYGTTGLTYAPNCSESPSCPSWSGVLGLGCFSTCGYTNLYRASDNSSVMNAAFLSGFTSFDSYSSQIVAGKLASYFIPVPPTPTIPPPLPTPTTTPLPTPTISPLPTITVNLRPTTSVLDPLSPASPGEAILTVTPSMTTTPTVSATPSPTQPPSCNFPNFCTKAKFCASENALTISCAGSELTCCKGQVDRGRNKITPTIAQRFELLPTIPVISQDRTDNPPVSTPVPAITTSDNTGETLLTIPTSSVSVIQPTNPQIALIDDDDNVVQTVLPSPAIVNQNQDNIPLANAAPTLSIQESYLSNPTVTPHEIENIVFERATPTPRPISSVLDILAAPSRFVNNIVKSFFSLFSRKN